MPFTVRPFAFMRLTHEALRAGFARLVAHAESGDLPAVQQEYDGLRPVLVLHAEHEEQVFFDLLDERCDGAVEAAGLRDAHVREEGHQQAFEAALAARDLAGVREALAGWASSFEEHLAHEEEVMMPLTQRVAPTVEGRAAAVGTILDVDFDALKSDHLPYVVHTLATTKPYGPTRMFVAALQAAAGPRYAELTPVLRRALPEALQGQLQAHGHLG